jgi:hypothetical protein
MGRQQQRRCVAILITLTAKTAGFSPLWQSCGHRQQQRKLYCCLAYWFTSEDNRVCHWQRWRGHQQQLR